MTTYVVTYTDNAGYIKPLLPRCTTPQGRDVIFHKDPDVRLAKWNVLTNFQIAIGPYAPFTGHPFPGLPTYCDRLLPLIGKHEQVMSIMRYWERVHPEQFMPVPTHSDNNSCPNGIIVAKPEYGARSTGMFLIDTDFVDLDEWNNIHHPSRNREPMLDYLQQFGGRVAFVKGNEFHTGEAINNARVEDVNYVYTEYVNCIKEEWRILTNHEGLPIWAEPRMLTRAPLIVPDPHVCAFDTFLIPDLVSTSTTRLNDTYGLNPLSQNDSYGLWRVIKKDVLIAFCKDVVGPMSSLDVFITDTDHWGVFEYSREYSTSRMPGCVVKKIAGDYLDQCIDLWHTHEGIY